MSKRAALTDNEEEEDDYRQLLTRQKKQKTSRVLFRSRTATPESANLTSPVNDNKDSISSNSNDSNKIQSNSNSEGNDVDVASSDESPDTEEQQQQSINEKQYLETIDRTRLDFDFENLCSVSLSNNNVYACLTCGKYFQGRGKTSHAYFHSIDQDHHVYINLQSLKIYILPNGYEVDDPSLDDIKYVANPIYTKAQVANLDKLAESSYDLFHNAYRPGFIGMNNIKENDYANVVVQALAHTTPLRNFLMLENLSERPELVKRLSLLVRKIWNRKAFKPHVSPHELLQQVSQMSNKRFSSTVQKDPFDFMNWLLNNTHLALGGSKTKPFTSIVQFTFQGKVEIQTQKITARAVPGDRLKFEADELIQSKEVPFMFLSLELPPVPLFKGDLERNAIPQVSLTSLLKKYDGNQTQELAGHRKRYKIKKLPNYLVFHIKRFDKTNLDDGKNPTVVSFDPRGLDMSPYVDNASNPIYYDLVANIVIDVNSTSQGAEKHSWAIQLLDKATNTWVQIQDLIVKDVRSELLFLNESYIQVWEKRK